MQTASVVKCRYRKYCSSENPIFSLLTPLTGDVCPLNLDHLFKLTIQADWVEEESRRALHGVVPVVVNGAVFAIGLDRLLKLVASGRRQLKLDLKPRLSIGDSQDCSDQRQQKFHGDGIFKVLW